MKQTFKFIFRQKKMKKKKQQKPLKQCMSNQIIISDNFSVIHICLHVPHRGYSMPFDHVTRAHVNTYVTMIAHIS